MSIKSRLLSIILLLITVSCATTTTVRSCPNYEKSLHDCNSIAALPPKAEVNMVGFGEKKRMYDFEYKIEDIIHREALEILKTKGYKISKVRKRDIKDKKAFREFNKLRDDLNKETNSLYKPRVAEKEEIAFNISNVVGKKNSRVFGQKTSNDVLLFVDYLNEVKTTGLRTTGLMLTLLSAAAGVNTSSADPGVDKAYILVTLIEAKTGKILWANMGADSEGFFVNMANTTDSEYDNKRLRALLEHTLSSLPDKKDLLRSKEEPKKK